MKTTPLLLCALLPLVAEAGNATFSADGKALYLLPLSEGDSVYKVDPATKKHLAVQPIKNLGKDTIKSVARNPQGEILLCTGKSIWIWSGTEAPAKKWLDLPEKFQCLDMSCTIAKGTVPAGTVFLHGTRQDEDRFSLLTWSAKKQTWLEVFCRRNEPYAPPQTNASGRMFFASDADLWEGTMIAEAAEDDDVTIAGSMEGCRIAPLAMLNADSGNSGGMVVGEVVAAGSHIFSLLEGRHMGALLQTPAPAKPLYADAESNEHPDLAVQYKLMQDSLAQTKIHYSGGPCDALCVHETSHSEYQVFWRQDHEGDRAWMWMNASQLTKKIGTEPAE